MSRDVFYLVPSESDGRQEQQQQATTSERVNAERTHEANATNPDIDRIEPIDTQSQEPPIIQPLLKERVYFAAKDGLPIALLSLLSNIESDALKNAYINQVSHGLSVFHFNFSCFRGGTRVHSISSRSQFHSKR